MCCLPTEGDEVMDTIILEEKFKQMIFSRSTGSRDSIRLDKEERDAIVAALRLQRRGISEDDKHYLSTILVRLVTLYDLTEAPNVREQISDEVSWVEEKLGVHPPVDLLERLKRFGEGFGDASFVCREAHAELSRLYDQRRPGTIRPLTEGYTVKGGHNTGPSQITERPPRPEPSKPFGKP